MVAVPLPPANANFDSLALVMSSVFIAHIAFFDASSLQ